MKRKLLTALVGIVTIVFLNSPAIHADNTQDIDFEGQGFSKIKCTAYCCGTTTANGSPVHEGGLASDYKHRGQVAILYTLDGEYLGIFEANDAGGTDAIRNGYVIDIYRTDYDRCVEWMEKTKGKVYVKWIEGEG